MSRTDMGVASIYPRKTGFALKWPDEYDREESLHPSRNAAKEAYFISLAWDYLGSAIRDNSHSEKILLGRAIEKYGVNDAGDIDWPKGED